MLEAAMTMQDPAAPAHDAVGPAALEEPSAVAEASPPVILSKVRIPRQRSATLDRGRLLGWLEQRATDRVVVVVAEVGYGKSTLLADYARRSGARCVWYRVEESDGDWISFIGHLVAAIRVSRPGFGASSEALLRHVAAVGPSREVVTSSLLAEIGGMPPERTLVVLDDFHLVDGSEDVRSIMRRLLENAPEDWHFVLAARGRPGLPLGRLAGQGVVAELSTQDLRFTRAEVGELFDVHRHQLSSDVLDLVHERTQGWAASLQLVLASVATSRPDQVEAFIKQLSGARGPIHDLLAQEVLGRLETTMQQVVIHASLLDRVTPGLVVAAMSESPHPVDIPAATVCLVQAERLGLLVASDHSGSGARFHPLLREFLRHRLDEAAPPHRIAAMHVAIAREAEADDWLAAGSHYALGGEPDEAMRVLGAAAYKALGTGAWGAASAIVDSTPGAARPPAVEVIRARALIAEGRALEALDILSQVESASTEFGDLSILRLTRANALQVTGNHGALVQQLRLIQSDQNGPALARRVADAWLQMLVANGGGSIVTASKSLLDLAADVASEGLFYFAGVALHNAAGALLAMGRWDEAERVAVESAMLSQRTDSVLAFAASTKLVVAHAKLEMGNFREALSIADNTLGRADATPDALAEGAYLAALVGRRELADVWLERFAARAVPGQTDLGTRFQSFQARVALAASRGEWIDARKWADKCRELSTAEIDGPTRMALVDALIATSTGATDSTAKTSRAWQLVEKQAASRWGGRVRILAAVSSRNRALVDSQCDEAIRTSPASLLETAPAIAHALDLFDDVPIWLDKAVVTAPAHWLPILRRRLASEHEPPASAAAALISEYGVLDDVTILRAFERRHGSSRRRRGLASKLTRRVSPTIRVHDLGLVTCEVGARTIELSEARRRASALLLFLISRSGQSAARDMVMENLWPDQPPHSALNSLHQTLFFLRRLIEPWQDEGVPSAYVRMEADVVSLNLDLFQIDSVAFQRQAVSIIANKQCATLGPGMLRLYRGTFAPEFEYEHWADDWRTQVHSTFLRLADGTTRDLLERGRQDEAVDLLTHAVAIDPAALELRGRLVRAMVTLGSKDAAMAQYRGLVAAYERELGEAAPSFDNVVNEDPPM